ncbi:MAG: HipA domain-containing protein [Oligoflexia bacterium]|nr:HipA domain-containing protein [Oligoflexia bacterium]
MNFFKKCFVCYEDIEENKFYHSKCGKNLFGTENLQYLEIKMDDIEKLAKENINKRLTIPGVQKKLSLDIKSIISSKAQRITFVGALGGTHILKPPTEEYPDMPEIENLTMNLAKICNIKTAEHGLIQMADGTIAYITKRFDRIGKLKVAVEDLCQLSEMLTEQKYKSSSEKVGKIIAKYATYPGNDLLNYFELLIFSFLTGNSDMHLKNFSLLTNDKGIISLSPAYDLLSTRLLINESDDPEELALAINGKKNKIELKDFLALGKNLNIPDNVVRKSIARFTKNIVPITECIGKSILKDHLKKDFKKLIEDRLGRIV